MKSRERGKVFSFHVAYIFYMILENNEIKFGLNLSKGLGVYKDIHADRHSILYLFI